MKQKKYLLITFLIILLCNRLLANAPVKDFFILSGNIEDRDIDSVIVKYYASYSDYLPSKDSHAVVKNGQFNLKIDGISEIGYVEFKVVKATSNDNEFLLPISTLFLVQPGDNIRIKQNGKVFQFSGLGSAKYNCSMRCDSRSSEIWNNFDYSVMQGANQAEMLNYYLKLSKDILTNQFKILDEYKSSIDHETYALLKLDFQSKNKLNLLRYFSSTDIGFNPFNDIYKQLVSPILNEAKRPDLSAYYADFLLKVEILKAAWNPDNTRKIAPVTNQLTINRVVKEYEGSIRDKLLAIMLTKSFTYPTDTNIQDRRQLALSIVRTGIYKKIILDDRIKFARGSQAFDFSLQDSTGKVVNLHDFKGKVVFVDFYFDGCTGCARLSKALTPVISEFKGNPEVVFLSICTSKPKQLFIKAVNSQLYTHPETVNLYTNGLGTSHPLIEYYGFRGYPQYLLIDKAGRILHENPPRPELNSESESNPSDPGVLGLIKIIKDSLDENKS